MLVSNILFNVGFLLIIAIIGAEIFKKFRLPAVLIYILIGMLLSPALLNLINPTILRNDFVITQLTLSLIAFSIGDTFLIGNLKQVGKEGATLSILQAVFTTIIVIMGLLLLNPIIKIPISAILLLGAIAAATAPASTYMVIREYNAKGTFTNYLLAAVSIDDAVGIVLFDLMVVIGKIMTRKTALEGISSYLFAPIIDILLSLAIGFAMGLLLSFVLKNRKSNDFTLMISLGTVLVAAGLCINFNLSPLLCCMALGGAFSNFSSEASRTYELIDKFTPPIFLIFFIVSGAGLDIKILAAVGILGIAVIILRTIGKIYGTSLAGEIAKAPKEVSKYLGYAMLPQAGVAIGFAISVKKVFPEFNFITTVVLANVIYSQIIGPILAKYALFKTGEAKMRTQRDS
jgi:Kef-type K+ transport system membrane component KefB